MSGWNNRRVEQIKPLLTLNLVKTRMKASRQITSEKEEKSEMPGLSDLDSLLFLSSVCPFCSEKKYNAVNDPVVCSCQIPPDAQNSNKLCPYFL